MDKPFSLRTGNLRTRVDHLTNDLYAHFSKDGTDINEAALHITTLWESIEDNFASLEEYAKQADAKQGL